MLTETQNFDLLTVREGEEKGIHHIHPLGMKVTVYPV